MDHQPASDQAFRPAPDSSSRSFPGGQAKLPRLDEAERSTSPKIEMVSTAFARGGTTEDRKVAPVGFNGYFTTESLFDEPEEDLEAENSDEPFRVLGVEPDAKWEEIAAAFRGLVKEFHPDQFNNADQATIDAAETKIKEITHAYGVLRRIRTDRS